MNKNKRESKRDDIKLQLGISHVYNKQCANQLLDYRLQHTLSPRAGNEPSRAELGSARFGSASERAELGSARYFCEPENQARLGSVEAREPAREPH